MSATISACGQYRYSLSRIWGDGPLLGFVMLNPSTADGEQDDPTIRRCKAFARDAGFAGIVVGNLFAWRATAARELRQVGDPIGPDNDLHLKELIARPNIVVCAWGAGGTLMDRGQTVLKMMREARKQPYCLRLSSKGVPMHPLYLPASLRPTPIVIGAHLP